MVPKWMRTTRKSSDDKMDFAMDGTDIPDAGYVEQVYAWGFELIGFTMIISPLWILVFVTAQIPRLVIMTCFLLAFLGFTSFVTTARPFETLGATAAYGLVLFNCEFGRFI